MQKRKMTIASIACGVVCALCVLAYLLSVQGRIDQARTETLERYGGDQVEVCVAKRDIAPGQTIGSGDVETKLWVATLLPTGAVSVPSEAVGSQASSVILSGEVITTKRLGGESSALEVPEGFVAVSVPARNVQAVGGAVSPGLRVDVYSTGNTSTSRIGQNLLVLATSASSDEASSVEVTWVTLAVKPAAVQEFVSAAQSSSLYFTIPAAKQQ